EVLGAAGQVHEALGIDPGAVTGVQPAVDQLALAVQDVSVVVASDDVAREHGGTADRQHTRLFGGQVLPAAVGADADGLHPLVGQPLPDRARPGRVGE